MYIGENFNVHFHENFNFWKFLEDNSSGGLIHSDFIPNKKFTEMMISNSAKRIRDVPNAGGSSVISEVLSFEFLNKACQAELLKTEMEVSYFPEGGSITDYVCKIFDRKVGVSVTRAMKYRGQYTEEDAHHLLTKKLKGVIQSSKNSMEKWSKQILHVWVPNKHTANTITKVYNQLSANIRSNTIVMVTRSSCSSYIYTNG
ncbi:AAC-rich mRNA clone AAC4 protein-like [Mytilus galloprovincialis]|uniref:AAC-rich mRNA clone AAC4 protein-like n=1 Tax=Mytilus edulis TaxID=6550 RepID=UPI0039EEC26B